MVMENKSYKLVVPVTHTHCLEIISKKHSMQHSGQRLGAKNIKVFESADKEAANYSELPQTNKLPKEFLQLIELTQSILTQYVSTNRTLMIATATGYQLLQANQIVCFEYSKTKKQWSAILTDRSCLLLKRSTIANDILDCSPSFIRINHQHIINFGFLSGIDDKVCKLSVPISNSEELIISRNYLKTLQETIKMI